MIYELERSLRNEEEQIWERSGDDGADANPNLTNVYQRTHILVARAGSNRRGTNGVWSTVRSFVIMRLTTPTPTRTSASVPPSATPSQAPSTPTVATDTVSTQLAEYSAGNDELRVEATGSNASAILRVYVTSINTLVGTLTNEGGGRYRGEFSWSTNPQNITVRSSLGGTASRTVTLK